MTYSISISKKFKRSELTPDRIADSISVAANLINSEIDSLDVAVEENNDEIVHNMKNLTVQELRECCCSDSSSILSVNAFIGDAHLWAIPKAGQLTVDAPSRDIAEMVLSAFLKPAN